MSVSSPFSAEEVLDSLSLAVVCIDAGLRVARVNPAAEVLFGVSAGYACGELAATSLPGLKPHLPRLREARDTFQAITEREMRLRCNGHGEVTVDCAVTPVATDAGTGLILEFHPLDRHLRISRDDQLWHQQQVAREMIRGMAHEVKNPLGGLRGAAQLLARELPDPALSEFTDVIIGEADRLQNLVDRLLGPHKPPSRAALNIHEVVERVRLLCEAQCPEGVRLERDYDPSLPDFPGDREQLIQALLNIARNAVQAVTPDGGRVLLRTRSQRQYTIGGVRHRLVLRIDVEDTGPGIPSQNLEDVFYPLVTTKDEGSGLGLAIAQNLIHNHGGLIECESEPGATVFSILLPLEESA